MRLLPRPSELPPVRARNAFATGAWRVVIALWAAMALLAAGCTHKRTPKRAAGATSTTLKVATHPRGGVVRVAVWGAPNPDDQTLGGAAVRQLVLPQLFKTDADGRWLPSLVAPGSDREAADHASASFAFRSAAVWSDGAPITADDLRRTADARFVAGIDGPAPDGRITVHFTAPLANWKRLWSFTDSIAAPSGGVWGGPFVVASVTPGLETVLARNDHWYGDHLAFLDEVHLVLVPDSVMQRQLLDTKQVDVVMPMAATARTPGLKRLVGVRVDATALGGWYDAIIANPEKVNEGARRSLLASFDRAAFVKTLFVDEVLPLNGLAGPGDMTWTDAGVGDVSGLKGTTVQLSVMNEAPMVGLVHRSMQKRARGGGRS